MQRRRVFLTLGGYIAVVLCGVPFAEGGGFFSYAVVGAFCGLMNLRAAARLPEFRRIFQVIAAFVGTFLAARIVETLELASSIVNATYSFSYLLALVAVAVLVKLRVRRWQTASALEAVLVSSGVLLLTLQFQVLLPTMRLSTVNVFVIVSTTFLMSVAFLGRSAAGPAWPLWFTTVIVSAVVEVVYGFRETDVLASFLTVHLGSAAFVPLTLVTILDQPVRMATRDEMLVRRPIGRRQLVATFILLIMSPAVLFAMVQFGASYYESVAVVVCSVVVTGGVVWRFDLLVRDRDLSFRAEETLRALSEELVMISERTEMFAAVAVTVETLAGSGATIGFLADAPAGSAGQPLFLVRSGSFIPIEDAKPDDEAASILERSAAAPTAAHPAAVTSSADMRSIRGGSFLNTSTVAEETDLPRSLKTVEAILRLSLDALEAREESHQQRADSRFRALVQDSNDIIVVVGRESGNVEFVGPTLERLLGHRESAYVGADALRFVHPEDQRAVSRDLAVSPGRLEPFDIRVRAQDQHYHWFSLSVRDLADESELEGLLYSFVDINERKMAELQLLASEGRYRALVKNAKDVFALIDGEGKITFVSPNVVTLLGYTANDLIGTDVMGLLTDRGAAALDDALRRNGRDLVDTSLELDLRTANDEERTVEVVFSDPGLGDEEESLVTVRDVTEQRRLEESLRYQSLYDPLTGLFNRASIYPELTRGLQGLAPTETIAVLHLNVVDFRKINESVGFGEADRLLVEIASRLRSVLRSEDKIGRFNADEFAVVTTAPTLASVFELASRLLATFEESFVVDDRSINVKAVLGLDASTDRRQNAIALIENAALAMRAARNRGNAITIFEESMRAEATQRFELVSDFQPAIEDEQFSLVYQPLFDLDQNKVSSVEALLRWNHPDRGLVSPAVFIPLAEESGFIVELGRWVLNRSCQQLVDWHERLPDGRALSMSVNVSARQLELAGESEILMEIIDHSGVDKRSLTLELTETVLIEDADWLRDQLEAFRVLGIKIAVDDFGAGAAGLNHLRDVPFDVLKIDKSYIDNLAHSREAHSLVSGVIELAHGMQTKLVAEGIETPQQASILRQMGCDFGQGFYLGRPMASGRLEEWFAQGRDGSAAAVIVRQR